MPLTNKERRAAFVDKGFGFPVCLVDVLLMRVRGVWTPQINHRAYAAAVLEALACKPGRLTGNEIHFIRLQSDMTLKGFSARFGQRSHQAVMKWEACGMKPTSMIWTTEKDIRLFILERLNSSASRFRDLYQELIEPRNATQEPMKIEAEKLAA